jgi:hypothetical protein
MSEIINVFAKYSNGVARAYVENGIDLMETYFRETGSNARVYITCIYDFIKIQPVIQLPRGKEETAENSSLISNAIFSRARTTEFLKSTSVSISWSSAPLRSDLEIFAFFPRKISVMVNSDG